MKPFTRRCTSNDVLAMIEAVKDGDIERWGRLHDKFYDSWNKSAGVLIETLVWFAGVLAGNMPLETLAAQAEQLTSGPEENPAAAKSRKLLARSLFGSPNPAESFPQALGEASQDASLSNFDRVMNLLSMATTAGLIARKNDVRFETAPR